MDARGEIDGGSGGCCSKGLAWQSWELGDHIVAGDGGGNGGGS